MKVVQFFKIYNFDVVQKIYLTKDSRAKIKNIEEILNLKETCLFQRNFTSNIHLKANFAAMP